MFCRINLRTTASLSLVAILLAINTKCSACAQTDAQRRRQFLKMLTPDAPRPGGIGNDADIKHFANFGGYSNNNTRGITTNTDRIIGGRNNRGKKHDKEPPLVGGESDTQLTPLTMMGKFKKTWCKTEPFMQLIKEPGCIKRRVLNRFCYGQCNSFYIPKTLRKRMKKKMFKSCGVCKPKRTHTIVVTLKCPGLAKGYKHKKVKQIKQCRCMER